MSSGDENISIKRDRCATTAHNESSNGPQDDNTTFGKKAKIFLSSPETEPLVYERFSSVSNIFIQCMSKVRSFHTVRIVWFVFLIALVTSGNAMQIIGLNFWLRSFPKDGGPWNFTTLAVSSLIFGAFFLVLLTGYILLKRPHLAFLRHSQGWWILFLIGLFDAVNSFMTIYAASYTPEVLQALFTSLVPVYSAVFTKLILKDPRKYFNIWIFASFTLIVSGVLVVSVYQFSRGFEGDSKKKTFWSLIFFFSVPPTVLMNVFQALYMLEFTQDSVLEEADLIDYRNQENTHANLNTFESHDGGVNAVSVHEMSLPLKIQEALETPYDRSNDDSPLNTIREARAYPVGGKDTIVKLVMLSVETNIQLFLIMIAFPMDALSWWGGSKTLQDAWGNFSTGIWCVFHRNETTLYCMVYTTGFIFTYIGSAYLNQYSVTLCSMVGQMSSPFTALLLVVVPALNLEKGCTPWYLSALAVVLLCVGSVVYALWEERTNDEKSRGERLFKRKLLARMHACYLPTICTETVLLSPGAGD